MKESKELQQCPMCDYVFESNPNKLEKTVFKVTVWERPGSTDVGQVEEAFVESYLEKNDGETFGSVELMNE